MTDEITPVSPEVNFSGAPVSGRRPRLKRGGIFIILFIVLLVGLVVMWIFVRSSERSDDERAPNRQSEAGLEVPVAIPLPPDDSDADGLTDDEERRARTNPTDPDTDADGLSDFTEINETKTDPLQADTDRDGLRDGEELFEGKNPLKKN